jgi:hypothetical protein
MPIVFRLKGKPMPLKVLNGPFIAAGESISDALDCSDGRIVKITMPGNWAPAELTFQTSSDGELYNDIFDHDGNEVMCSVHPGTAIIMELNVGWIKFRSGTRATPVPQPELREFAVAIATGGSDIGVSPTSKRKT